MKVLFGSYHNLFDLGSGAAISARVLLRELVQCGAEAAAVSGAFFDGDVPSSDAFLLSLRRQGVRYDVKKGTIKHSEGQKLDSFQLVHYDDDGIDSTAFLPEDAFAPPQGAYDISLASSKAFHRLLYDKIAVFSPDVFLSYGGYRTALNGPRIAKRFGATSVFYLSIIPTDARNSSTSMTLASFPPNIRGITIVILSESTRSFYRRRSTSPKR